MLMLILILIEDLHQKYVVSVSSTICTLMLPFLRSDEKVRPSRACSRGKTWDTSFLTSIRPPSMQAMPAGQVSLYLLMNRSWICLVC